MSFVVELISPKESLQLEVETIILPGELGQFGILENHANIISKLSSGIITVDNVPKFRISAGFAHMHDGALTISVNTIEVL